AGPTCIRLRSPMPFRHSSVVSETRTHDFLAFPSDGVLRHLPFWHSTNGSGYTALCLSGIPLMTMEFTLPVYSIFC
ncbi:MAG: hypothetical protein K2M65_00350, partial [Muribaculaceae bacterium]|nr:hypothetical protein [Muribaculaceae bacterium]